MKNKNVFLWCVVGVILVATIAILMNRQVLIDQLRAMNYHPSEVMGRIMNDLKLTDRGEFIFKASQPELNGRGEFNAHCRTDVSVESAVLGCYVDDSIYVYDIESEELDGIRELTTAHELLHAVWARMGEGERRGLTEALTHVFEENQSFLGSEIDGYDTPEKQEELYVRAGTEVADLPEELEKHYAEIFKDQDGIVGFYKKYITVFWKTQTELNELAEQMKSLKDEIESKTAKYGQRAEQFKTDVASFNECAGTEGCFNSQWTFDAKREELLVERGALEEMHEEISGMVERYNGLVEKYNADVIYSDRLNSIINSSIEPAEVE